MAGRGLVRRPEEAKGEGIYCTAGVAAEKGFNWEGGDSTGLEAWSGARRAIATGAGNCQHRLQARKRREEIGEESGEVECGRGAAEEESGGREG